MRNFREIGAWHKGHEHHLLLAKDLNFIDMAAYNQLDTAAIEVKKMLASFIKRIREDNQHRRK